MPGELEYEELVAEANHPDTPPDRLQTLAKRGGAIAVAVAQNPNTPGALLESFCRGANLLLLFGVIANPSTPGSRLAELAKHQDRGIRRAVAACARTPKETKTSLEQDRDRQVRNTAFWGFAKNPEELRAAKDQRLYQMAAHRQTPIAQLMALASDGSWVVRYTIARNKSTPGEALSFLADDARTRRVALTNLNIPRAVLARYAADPDPAVRRAIANNPMSSRELLGTLLQDQSALVRRAAARNLNLLREQLEPIVQNDPDLGVRAAAARSLRTRVSRNGQLRRIKRLGLELWELWRLRRMY